MHKTRSSVFETLAVIVSIMTYMITCLAYYTVFAFIKVLMSELQLLAGIWGGAFGMLVKKKKLKLTTDKYMYTYIAITNT